MCGLCAPLFFFSRPFLSMSFLTCSVKQGRWGEVGGGNPQRASSAWRTHVMCHRFLCCRIPVPVLATSATQTDVSPGTFIIGTPSFLLFFFFSFFFTLPLCASLHLGLSRPPPTRFPSLSLHSLVSGWKVQWGCGIPEGQRGRGGGPPTRACVCKPGGRGAPRWPICQRQRVCAGQHSLTRSRC